MGYLYLRKNATSPVSPASQSRSTNKKPNIRKKPFNSSPDNRPLKPIMHFPTRKSDILMLADRMIAGLSEKPKPFPDPPFELQTLRACLDNVKQAIQTRQAAKASLIAVVREENDRLAQLKQLVRQIHRSSKNYQPEFPEHFQRLTAAVHANPRQVPIMYLRRFGVLL
jgi:hypothetical protein